MTQVDLALGDIDVADAPTRPGRKRDHTRDPEILEAALDVLSESGYDGMTVDMVAARAKAGKATLYRRWPSKAELVLDAIACVKPGIPLDELPDTGTLRGDLVAMVKPHTILDAERKLKVMAGVVSMLTKAPELTDSITAVFVEPRRNATRALLRRAVERGEIRADVDIETLSLVSASMATYRTLLLRKPVDRRFLLSVIDEVIMPAVRKA